jgi:hypothetical protein
LCIAGPQVARGYRGQVAATAEKFLTRTDVAGGRLYRTGDRARLSAGGELIFLGRLDRQIKIRGYRVELDEIAAQLSRHPAIRSCAVIAPEGPSGEPIVTAYLSLSPNAGLSDAEIRRFLSPHLAAYMIPERFVRLEALPMTPNGKCDYEALPAPGPGNALSQEESQDESHGGSQPNSPGGVGLAASDSVTARLCVLIGGLMGVPEIRPGDNFFLIGGHSLLAAQLMAKVRAQFGVSLSLRQVFESPTAELLALAIERSAVGVRPVGAHPVGVQPAGVNQ